MSETKLTPSAGSGQEITRRHFLAGTGAAALSFTLIKPELVGGAEANSKITLGLIGCGGRGNWIANLFNAHGGYKFVGVADYFADQEVQYRKGKAQQGAEGTGNRLNVPAANRFSGLSGYKRLLDLKPDAIVIETPPYFHPEQARAGVDAGCHVYCAKPIAVDVPGCLTIEQSGKKATEKKLVFLVDFQTRANSAYQEVVKRCRDGQIGKVISAEATYQTGHTWGRFEELLKGKPADPEIRLHAWGIDRVLSGDIITEQNIHCLDVASWFMDAAPERASGMGGLARGVGTCWDHFAVIYYFPGGKIVSFSSKQVGFGYDDILCRVYGTAGTIDTHYSGAVTMRAKEDGFTGNSANLFESGAVQNIATFHNSITRGDFSNPTVTPSVRSNLTTILGRTAAYQNRQVTWEEMIKANEKWEYDVTGLKA